MDTQILHQTTYFPRVTPETGQALAQMFIRKFPATAKRLNGRIEAAVKILDSAGIRHAEGFPSHVYQVPSQSNTRGSYQVDIKERTCTCPDSGKGNLCKHRLAIGFYMNQNEWIREFQELELLRAAKTREQSIAAHLLEFRQRERAAWGSAYDCINAYETLTNTPAPDGSLPAYDAPEVEQARQEMLNQVEKANTATRLVMEFIASCSAKSLIG